MSAENDNLNAGMSATAAVPAPDPASAVAPESANSNSEPPASAQESAPELPASPDAAANDAGASAESTAEAAAETAAEATPESAEGMNELMQQYAAPQTSVPEGELVEGRVVAVTDLGVVVDVGSKTEGLIPAQEFIELGGVPPFESHQTIDVQFTGEEKEGYVILSYLRARRRKAWENIEQSYHSKLTLTGKVVDRIKGGLVVDVGVRAFLPASHLDVRPTHDLDGWKGKDVEVRVLKMNRKRGNVVVSRRAILEEELKSKRDAVMSTLVEGAVIKGRVKNLTEYGAFVDLGGVDGLLHVTDITWGRISHPSEALTAGQELDVKILKFDKDKQRVSLGHKQLQPDPWEAVPTQFTMGARVQGRVVGITDYGAFIEIAPGVEGLVHVSEMSWSKRQKHPSKVVHVGDEVEVQILDIKPAQRRISLGLKQTQPDPWQLIAEKYPVGTKVTGKVRSLTDFGAFIEIEEGIDGLLHVSDISWTERVKDPSELYKKGDVVEAKVLKVDVENHRLSLGVKQLNDIWSDWFLKHKVNDVIRGRVARSTTFGVFVQVADGIEALCHISEIEDRRKGGDKDKPAKPGKPTVHLEVGQEYDFKIIQFDPNQHRIKLSYRAAQKQVERKEMEEYRSSRTSSKATIGDLMMAKRSAPSRN